jgi:hypothetical protein
MCPASSSGLYQARAGESLESPFKEEIHMRMCLLAVLVLGQLAAAWIGPQLSSQPEAEMREPAKESAPAVKLKVGEMAPNFALLAFDGKEVKKVSLHDYRGRKNVALAFYVFAFTDG